MKCVKIYIPDDLYTVLKIELDSMPGLTVSSVGRKLFQVYVDCKLEQEIEKARKEIIQEARQKDFFQNL